MQRGNCKSKCCIQYDVNMCRCTGRFCDSHDSQCFAMHGKIRWIACFMGMVHGCECVCAWASPQQLSYIYMFCMHVLKFPWSRYSLAHVVVGCRGHDGRWECPSCISIFYCIRLHLMHACCYMPGSCLIWCSKKKKNFAFMDWRYQPIHHPFMHAFMLYSEIFQKMPFAERGSMVRLLVDVRVPKVGFWLCLFTQFI